MPAVLVKAPVPVVPVPATPVPESPARPSGALGLRGGLRICGLGRIWRLYRVFDRELRALRKLQLRPRVLQFDAVGEVTLASVRRLAPQCDRGFAAALGSRLLRNRPFWCSPQSPP